MHTCIPSHRLKISWHSCPRQVNAGNKNTPSMHHPRRQTVTTSMFGLKNAQIRKNLTKNGEPQRYSWERRRRRRRMVNPRDLAGNAEEEEGEWWTSEIYLGMQKKKKENGEPQRYSWECRRRRSRMVNPRDISGNAETEEEEEEWWTPRI